ncbi:hypothetical protein RFI_10929 [Reticulomyxa filosa]|uniref:Uncharacterized protein n=1 Tax=Reticulomyxa filosa TaxID=46433 RepID=X6NJW7_RETFI|nr:hypothetical protein RFI_10929 [Reticulomyxa filosa]|eukprot:ETO26208.1 hypothetical protein RFI_10929 [Reticulomyxa filosa]
MVIFTIHIVLKFLFLSDIANEFNTRVKDIGKIPNLTEIITKREKAANLQPVKKEEKKETKSEEKSEEKEAATTKDKKSQTADEDEEKKKSSGKGMFDSMKTGAKVGVAMAEKSVDKEKGENKETEKGEDTTKKKGQNTTPSAQAEKTQNTGWKRTIPTGADPNKFNKSTPILVNPKSTVILDNPEAFKDINGFEVAFASSIAAGDIDRHGNNFGISKDKEVVKIDQGKAGLEVYSTEQELRKVILKNFIDFGYAKEKTDIDISSDGQLVEVKTHKMIISFDIRKFKEALDQQQIGKDELENVIGNRVVKLYKADVNLIDHKYRMNLDSASSGDRLVLTANNKEDVVDFYVLSTVWRMNIAKELSNTLDIILKTNAPDELLKSGNWIISLADKDPIAWAKENGYSIEGKDPVQWAVNKPSEWLEEYNKIKAKQELGITNNSNADKQDIKIINKLSVFEMRENSSSENVDSKNLNPSLSSSMVVKDSSNVELSTSTVINDSSTSDKVLSDSTVIKDSKDNLADLAKVSEDKEAIKTAKKTKGTDQARVFSEAYASS